MARQECGESIVGEAACLGEAIHAFADLNVGIVVLDEVVEVV
jgi:hypothetical protein